MIFVACGSDDSDDGDPSLLTDQAPKPGKVIFNELMYDSKTLPDSNGEWIELKNVGDDEVNLRGCIFADDKHQSPIDVDVKIPAGGYAVLGITHSVLVTNVVPRAWNWGTFNLGNEDEAVFLSCGEDLIDQFIYQAAEMPFTPVKGSSIALCPGNDSAESNDDLANWAVSTAAMDIGDFGTPGAENESCE